MRVGVLAREADMKPAVFQSTSRSCHRDRAISYPRSYPADRIRKYPVNTKPKALRSNDLKMGDEGLEPPTSCV